MNLAQLIQSILTYFCTAGFVAACGYAAALSKRVTILEQQMKFNDMNFSQVTAQIDKILDVVTEISTRLTKLETKLEVKIEGNSKKNVD